MPEVERLPGLVFLQLKSQEENLLQLFMAHIILITKLKNYITQLWLGQT